MLIWIIAAIAGGIAAVTGTTVAIVRRNRAIKNYGQNNYGNYDYTSIRKTKPSRKERIAARQQRQERKQVRTSSKNPNAKHQISSPAKQIERMQAENVKQFSKQEQKLYDENKNATKKSIKEIKEQFKTDIVAYKQMLKNEKDPAKRVAIKGAIKTLKECSDNIQTQLTKEHNAYFNTAYKSINKLKDQKLSHEELEQAFANISKAQQSSIDNYKSQWSNIPNLMNTALHNYKQEKKISTEEFNKKLAELKSSTQDKNSLLLFAKNNAQVFLLIMSNPEQRAVLFETAKSKVADMGKAAATAVKEKIADPINKKIIIPAKAKVNAAKTVVVDKTTKALDNADIWFDDKVGKHIDKTTYAVKRFAKKTGKFIDDKIIKPAEASAIKTLDNADVWFDDKVGKHIDKTTYAVKRFAKKTGKFIDNKMLKPAYFQYLKTTVLAKDIKEKAKPIAHHVYYSTAGHVVDETKELHDKATNKAKEVLDKQTDFAGKINNETQEIYDNFDELQLEQAKKKEELVLAKFHNNKKLTKAEQQLLEEIQQREFQKDAQAELNQNSPVTPQPQTKTQSTTAPKKILDDESTLNK